MTLNVLNQKIITWAGERGILTGSTPVDQFKKTAEEFGELMCAILLHELGAIKNNDMVKDALGDIYVTVIIGAELRCPYFRFELPNHLYYCSEQELKLALFGFGGKNSTISDISYVFYTLNGVAQSYGLSLNECVAHAWNEIKDRKGQMIDGVFVKEADLL